MKYIKLTTINTTQRTAKKTQNINEKMTKPRLLSNVKKDDRVEDVGPSICAAVTLVELVSAGVADTAGLMFVVKVVVMAGKVMGVAVAVEVTGSAGVVVAT